MGDRFVYMQTQCQAARAGTVTKTRAGGRAGAGWQQWTLRSLALCPAPAPIPQLVTFIVVVIPLAMPAFRPVVILLLLTAAAAAAAAAMLLVFFGLAR